MKKLVLALTFASFSLYAGDVDMGLKFDKDSTMVVLAEKQNLAAEFVKKENSKYNTIVQLTGTKLTRRRVCKKNSDKIVCVKYSSGGKLTHTIDNFNLLNVGRVNGEYRKYYTAYIGNKNKYDCPFVVWDEYKSKFVSEDDRPICKDEYRIKYIGAYKNGQKVGTWTTTNKKGKVTRTQKYRYSKLREQ